MKEIQEAEKEELKNVYDVILCTCNETCSRRLIENLKVTDRIAQCIVDECGMATEPETLAAISKCQQAVLIGDHKQLQPVVKNRAAKESGLGKSLFQKYAETNEDLVTVLDFQYRMVILNCIASNLSFSFLIYCSIDSYANSHQSYFIRTSFKLTRVFLKEVLLQDWIHFGEDQVNRYCSTMLWERKRTCMKQLNMREILIHIQNLIPVKPKKRLVALIILAL